MAVRMGVPVPMAGVEECRTRGKIAGVEFFFLF